MITGSHDGQTIKSYRSRFEKISPLLEINEKGFSITMCHYCMRVWPKSHYNSWHLYGHSHGKLQPIGKSWDVGVDNNNFTPLSIDDIIKIMLQRPDNANYIQGKQLH